MSSNISVYRICGFCGSEFLAKKTTTKYCSLKCASKDYKRRLKNQKIESSNLQRIKIKNQPLIDLKDKEFLNVKQLALLLGFSVKTVYCLINTKRINAYNFSERKTLIRRCDIDALFEKPQIGFEIVLQPIELRKQAEIKDCYTITEIQKKFNISSGALYNLIKRNSISKFSQGKFTYVAKKDIEAFIKIKL
ncbi:helix-turn-helix domain-containing protein [Flavobacterium yafengii]|uniref:helix-turn-helix domain-containing protein n=1 Tax=Flavobacterium yafengii TaxID=3041253 RepID=UPI0024A8FBCB|nr:helix-turn-helix domain-containing protein [Flavobacterium yafengii]MDI5889158.1 helix-turn-helix domain-containing protein [Flavobacterium yafengii]